MAGEQQVIGGPETVAITDEEKLWAEFDKQEQGEVKPVEGAAGGDEHAFSTENQDDDKNQSSGDGGAGGEGTQGGAKPPASSSKPDGDIWAKASPELRAAHEAEVAAAARKAENDARAMHGRTVKAMRDTWESLKSSASGGADRRGQDQRKPSDLLAEKLGPDYPEMAEPLKEALGGIEQRVEATEAEARARRTDDYNRIESFLDEQQAILDGAVPDWQDLVFGAKTKDQYAAWAADQPARVRKLIWETNGERIFDGRGAAEVIGSFKEHLAAQNSPPADAGKNGGGGQSQGLSAERAARSEGLSSPSNPGRSRVALSGTPAEVDDPEAHWREMAADDPDEDAWRQRRRA